MAFLAVPTEITFTFRDRENTLSKTRIYAPPVGTLAVNGEDIYTNARAFAGLVGALSDCEMIGMSVAYGDRDNEVVGAGEVERKGVFTFATGNGTGYKTQVPGFLDSLLDVNQRTIAVAGPNVKPEVAAFVTALIDGPPGINNGAMNAAGISLVRAVDGRKAHVLSLLDRRGRSG